MLCMYCVFKLHCILNPKHKSKNTGKAKAHRRVAAMAGGGFLHRVLQYVANEFIVERLANR